MSFMFIIRDPKISSLNIQAGAMGHGFEQADLAVTP
jgi:hypothetical protein